MRGYFASKPQVFIKHNAQQPLSYIGFLMRAYCLPWIYSNQLTKKRSVEWTNCHLGCITCQSLNNYLAYTSYWFFYWLQSLLLRSKSLTLEYDNAYSSSRLSSLLGKIGDCWESFYLNTFMLGGTHLSWKPQPIKYDSKKLILLWSVLLQMLYRLEPVTYLPTQKRQKE